MIKCIAISDLHGDLPEIKESFDVLLIGGDICPTYKHTYDFQHYWMMQYFLPWVMELPFNDEASKVIFIGGNHDCYLDQEPKPEVGVYSNIYPDLLKPAGNRLVYLEDDEYIFEKLDGEWIKIYGTPWCKIFGNWWFMANDKTLKEKYNLIPDDVDILLTHDAPAIPPHGIITQGWSKGTNAGNMVLGEIVKVKMPNYLIYGHIHSSGGWGPVLPQHELTVFNDGDKSMNIVCASIKDENYDSVYEPHIFMYPGHEKAEKSAKDREE